MKNFHLQIKTFLLNVVAAALQDYESEIEVDTSLEISKTTTPLIHVKHELQMEYHQNSEDTTFVIFQDNNLSDFINRNAEDDETIGCVFEKSIISLVRYHDDNSVKLLVEANSGCNLIATSIDLEKIGIDADNVFEAIEDRIKSETVEFHTHTDINAEL